MTDESFTIAIAAPGVCVLLINCWIACSYSSSNFFKCGFSIETACKRGTGMSCDDESTFIEGDLLIGFSSRLLKDTMKIAAIATRTIAMKTNIFFPMFIACLRQQSYNIFAQQ